MDMHSFIDTCIAVLIGVFMWKTVYSINDLYQKSKTLMQCCKILGGALTDLGQSLELCERMMEILIRHETGQLREEESDDTGRSGNDTGRDGV